MEFLKKFYYWCVVLTISTGRPIRKNVSLAFSVVMADGVMDQVELHLEMLKFLLAPFAQKNVLSYCAVRG